MGSHRVNPSYIPPRHQPVPGDMETMSAWSRALRDPSLRDLPYKVETNEHGQLVVTPQWPAHGLTQHRIGVLLGELVEAPGSVAVEFAIQTPKGVKLPDVVWMSEERRSLIEKDTEASPVAPEICVEVLSKSNTRAEIEAKKQLYFECGALEVWTGDVDGRMHFFGPEGAVSASAIAPDFPPEVEA